MPHKNRCYEHWRQNRDRCTPQAEEQEDQGLLETVFLDGKLTKPISLSEIRKAVDAEL